MNYKEYPVYDPNPFETLKRLQAEGRLYKPERKAYKPRPRIRQPWRGTLNWNRHKKLLARKRKAANRRAKQTRKAQRRAS